MVRKVTMGVVSVAVLLGSATRAGADARRPDPRAGGTGVVAYSVVRMPDGGIQFSGHAPNLQFRKTSYKDGHFDFEIASQNDRVDVRMSTFAMQVTRGTQQVAFALNALGAEELAKVRALLAGSRAIKRYRGLAAALEARHDQSPEAYGVILGGAVIGWLDGDAAAPVRLARRTAGMSAPPAGRGAGDRVGLMFRVDMPDCWSEYEQLINNAWNDTASCIAYAAQQGLWQPFYMNTCSAAWVIRSEGYWFEYIACSAIPLRLS